MAKFFCLRTRRVLRETRSDGDHPRMLILFHLAVALTERSSKVVGLRARLLPAPVSPSNDLQGLPCGWSCLEQPILQLRGAAWGWLPAAVQGSQCGSGEDACHGARAQLPAQGRAMTRTQRKSEIISYSYQTHINHIYSHLKPDRF